VEHRADQEENLRRQPAKPIGGLCAVIHRRIIRRYLGECYRITGEDCYFMKLYLRSIDDLEPILDRFTPYGRTTTSIVHSAPVPPRSLPLVEDEGGR